jgi:hypothetical protein
MAGPDKWNLLLDVGWTVVLADSRHGLQHDKQELSECMSPSMRTDNAVEQNYACCVYVVNAQEQCDVEVWH